MTKEKIQQLDSDVSDMKRDIAVINTNIGIMKEDSKSTKSLLKWFILVGLTILTLVVVQIWSSAGDKKYMMLILDHNSQVIGDMAKQI